VNVNQVFRAGLVGKISILDLQDEVMSVERVDGAAIDNSLSTLFRTQKKELLERIA